MFQLLDVVDGARRKISPSISKKRKSELGQFMTPSNVARFMASLFPKSTLKTCHLLDAGAGMGALSCAFLDRWQTGGFSFESIEVTTYEIDEKLCNNLAQLLSGYNHVTTHIIGGNYIEFATTKGLQDRGYTHVILNPPYKKINSKSTDRLALRRVGIETVNLYSAFVALAVGETTRGGQIVAIIPRSFCNGPYFRPFRDFILARAAICHIHLFKSRNKTFRDDKVLQENIIIRLERGGQQGAVTVSTSTDDSFSDLTIYKHPFDRIVSISDPEKIIHVPTQNGESAIELSTIVRYSLSDIGVQISTGPVVDFRLKKHLRKMLEPGAVPLLYLGHLRESDTVWPIEDFKKYNAIMCNNETKKWLYPNGFYCVVRRLSSKEEKRRIVASIVNPAVFGKHLMLGFENHLNVFHEGKHGLPEALAHGLTVFLNTPEIDEYFRCFNGHTQVNATDLKLMKYPSRDILTELGECAMQQGMLTKEIIKAKLGFLGT